MVVLFRYASSLRNDYSYYRFFLLHFMAIAFPETQSDRRRFRWIFFARKLADSNRLFSLERTKMAVLSRVKQGHQWRHSHQPSRLRSYANELHRLACHLHKLGKKKPSTTVAFYYDRECSLVSVFFCPRNFFGSFFFVLFFLVGRTFFFSLPEPVAGFRRNSSRGSRRISVPAGGRCSQPRRPSSFVFPVVVVVVVVVVRCISRLAFPLRFASRLGLFIFASVSF